MSLDRSRVPFNRSNALFHRSNINRASIEIGKDSKIDFLTISIDQAKISTDQNTEFRIFNQEILELEFSFYQLYETIFSKLKYDYYNLSMLYTYIYNTHSGQPSQVLVFSSLFVYNLCVVFCCTKRVFYKRKKHVNKRAFTKHLQNKDS